MPETTGIWGMLDQLGDAAGKLADLYNQLVKAGLIKGPLINGIPIPYVPVPEPWYKSPYLPIGIGVGAVGAAGVYYLALTRKW